MVMEVQKNEQLMLNNLDKNIIDNNIYNNFIEIINDIFNYYLYGNKKIPNI